MERGAVTRACGCPVGTLCLHDAPVKQLSAGCPSCAKKDRLIAALQAELHGSRAGAASVTEEHEGDIEGLIKGAEVLFARTLRRLLTFTDEDLAETIEGGASAESGARQLLEAINRRMVVMPALGGLMGEEATPDA